MTSIVEIHCATAALPLAHPLQAGSLVIRSREYCCVRVTLDSGVCGEAFVMTRGLDVEGALSGLFAGRILGAPRRALGELRSAVRNIGWDGAISRAASALRLAALDARAREHGVPVWRELGAESAPSATAAVVIGYSQPGEGPEAADVRGAEQAVAAGAHCLKLMAGPEGAHAELGRLASIRDAVGPDIELALDANGSWTLEEAHAALPRLAEAGVVFVEEPWAYEHGLAGFDGLPEQRPELAFGEISASVIELEALARCGQVDHVRADATLVGGAEAWTELVPALAESRAAVFPHFWPEVHRHLVALAPRTSYLECALPGGGEFALEDLLAPAVHLHEGRIEATAEPGFGFELDWERIAHHASGPSCHLAV